MVGERHATAVQEYKPKNAMPSKYHRNKLVEFSSESFQAGNHTGVGILHYTMKNSVLWQKRKHK
jgi:hypothetical protein